MDLEQRKAIASIADAVREYYHVGVPVDDLGKIIREMGGVLREENLSNAGERGYVQKVNDGQKRFEVVVDSDQPETMKRFTISHELGHLYLHMSYNIDEEKWESQGDARYSRDQGNESNQNQASEFAAAFLMPEKEFKEEFDKQASGGYVNLWKVAEHFGVSADSASYRAKVLGYIPW